MAWKAPGVCTTQAGMKCPCCSCRRGKKLQWCIISKRGENSSFLPNKPQEKSHSVLGDPVL